MVVPVGGAVLYACLSAALLCAGVLPHLELAVSIIAAEFDPRDMEARNHMQRDAALAMRAIVTTFPMASFNKVPGGGACACGIMRSS